VLVPTSYHEALLDPAWKKAMNKKTVAFHYNQTWDLTALPLGKLVVS